MSRRALFERNRDRFATGLALSLLLLAGCTVTQPPNDQTGSTPGSPNPTAPPVAPDVPGAAPATIGGCRIFPDDNWWNLDIQAAPVDARSSAYIASIASDPSAEHDAAGRAVLHADFGSHAEWGMPYAVVPSSQPLLPITFSEYPDESDPGPYPIPLEAPVEAGSDQHLLVVQSGACRLYELYHASRTATGWDAGSGAVFDLSTNALRPEQWTSADEAGLPILPGLVRYDEVEAGEIRHALRFTVWTSGRGFVAPARHFGTSDDPNVPPMGARLRLKAAFDISHFSGQARVVLVALKRYGMFVADSGRSWFVSGATDSRWVDTDLDQLKTVPGSAFEVVATGPITRPSN
jgi:hypothetical protein